MNAPFFPSLPEPARRYNYWLGGKDHFEADRASGDALEKEYPSIRAAALANRGFHNRAVAFCAHAGIEQFLDIGTGIPISPNTHEIAQHIHPRSRIVYVDNDPIVLVHARALLTGNNKGATAYLDADLRDPRTILTSAEVTTTLDLTRPVAVLLIAVLHFLPDDQQARHAVHTLTETLPAGSLLVISHATADLLDPEKVAKMAAASQGPVAVTGRTRTQFAQFFEGFTILDPGITMVSQWRPAPDTQQPPPADVSIYGAVAIKTDTHQPATTPPERTDSN